MPPRVGCAALKRLKRHRRSLAVAASLLVPWLVYRAHSTDPEAGHPVDRGVRWVTAPLQGTLMWGVRSLSDFWSRYVDLWDARARLAESEIANLQLRKVAVEHARLERENRALRLLLELELRNPEVELLTAHVVGAGIGPGAQTLEIDRGSRHGLRRGLPVVAPAGLVGIVQRVGWNASQVVLLTDDRVSLIAESAETGARGRLRGQGGFRVALEDVPQSDGVHTGEVWVTAGLGGRVPSGIPVGRITDVEADPERPVVHAQIQPSAPLRRLTWVQVLLTPETVPRLDTPPTLQPSRLWRSLADAELRTGGPR